MRTMESWRQGPVCIYGRRLADNQGQAGLLRSRAQAGSVQGREAATSQAGELRHSTVAKRCLDRGLQHIQFTDTRRLFRLLEHNKAWSILYQVWYATVVR